MTAVATNVAAVERFLRMLWEPGSVGEVRILDAAVSAAGYFNDPALATKHAMTCDGKGNIFVTLNPADPALFARSANHLKKHLKNTTADVDILRRRWLFLDFDAVRKSGISSTGDELQAALNLATEVQALLTALGWPEPVFCMSGNGAYLLYRIELPNNPESTALIKAVLEELHRRYSTKVVHIDTSVGNAARLVGLVGTRKMKGDSTPDRPHRRSELIGAPEQLEVATEEQLCTLLPVKQESPKNGQRPGGNSSSPNNPDLVWMLDQLGLDYKDSGPDAAGVVRYNLKACPFCGDESGGYRCGVGQAPGGAYSGHCFCYPDRGWKDFKTALGLDRFFGQNRNGHTPSEGLRVSSSYSDTLGTLNHSHTQNAEELGTLNPSGGVLRRLSDVKSEKVNWRWKDRLPLGKITLVSGDPGDGKSWLSLAIATAVTSGSALPGDEVTHEPASVLLRSAEDGTADTIRPRLEKMGADLDKVVTWDATRDGRGKERWPSLVDDLVYLESVLAAGTYKLVIVDPVNAYLRGIDGHKDIDLRSVLGPLAQLAERFNVAIIIIRHLTKSSRDRAIYRGAGGIGYTGAARVEWLVGRNPDNRDERVIAVIKNNLAPEAPSIAFEIVRDGEIGQFFWRGETSVTKEQLLAPDSPGEQRSQKQSGMDFLLEALAHGEVASDELVNDAASIGVSRRTLFRAKEELGVTASRRGIPGQRGKGEWFWQLPEGLTVPSSPSGTLDTLNPSQTQKDTLGGIKSANPTVAPEGQGA